MPSGLSFAAMDITALPHSFSPLLTGIVSAFGEDWQDSKQSAKHAAARVYKNRVAREDAIFSLSLRPFFVNYSVLYHSLPRLARLQSLCGPLVAKGRLFLPQPHAQHGKYREIRAAKQHEHPSP